uniref:4-hydroxytryptamine kinase n=1 Tax=Psilocybe cyanescens TaxID=93625 RepID=PSIK_PSICY|nr:RecName: Full=4-hydroxytryptamine kinase; AltName: Full=Psilocybin biosynthesis kinase [Psilocybe cyanescens]ASU62240.1 4-hydroxytryptamine kinase [Psilocybe cyanescens]
MTFDLKTEEGLLSYLTKHLSLDVAPNGVKRLSGGFVNVTWRVGLNAPYHGHTSIILKHAQPHLSSDIDFKIGVERSAYEYQALKIVSANSSLLGSSDIRVSVPEGLHYDVVNNALIMQDVGTMKTLLDYVTAKPPISAEIASLVGSQIGAFIARLHNLGRENKDKDDFKFFSGNIVGRTTADQLYQTIIPNAAKYGIDDPILPIVVKELVEEVMNSEETLIMADLWSGNILLQFDENSTELTRIWLVDWELCKYGPPSLDMGYFLGDCFLVARFQDQLVGTSMRQAYLKSYARNVKEPINYAKATAGIGAHLVMWTDFMKWGNDEEREEFVKKGVEAFHEANEDNRNGEITSILVKEASRT